MKNSYHSVITRPGFSVFFFFYLGFTARQDYYFTHFEPRQSYGGAKMGDPREKPPDQAELGLSHI